MDFTFRLVSTDDPDGEIGLPRLVAFGRRFQNATFRSAQAELSIPAFRKSLGDEPRPMYRLKAIGEGSTRLTIASVDERPLSRLAVTRHLDAIRLRQETGNWPVGMYRGELEAWGEFYSSVLGGLDRASVEVSDGVADRQVDRTLVAALKEAHPEPEYRRISCVGSLHMIEVKKRPQFRIDTEEVDLMFEVEESEVLSVVDPLRWQRVQARAIWEVGTNRARLSGPLELSEAPAGVVVEEEVELPGWVTEQFQRLESLKDLRQGWEGPASRAISKTAAESAHELTRQIALQFGSLIPAEASPYFFPNEEGHLEFEWQVDDRFLLCVVRPDGYLVLATRGSETLHEGQITQAGLFGWLRWLFTGEDAPA
jgi:hypothetical protein